MAEIDAAPVQSLVALFDAVHRQHRRIDVRFEMVARRYGGIATTAAAATADLHRVSYQLSLLHVHIVEVVVEIDRLPGVEPAKQKWRNSRRQR